MATQLFPKFLGAESKASRNGFDKSARHVFSSKVGMMISPFQLHYIPGEEAKIDVRALTRTQPISTAAFTRMNQHYDFYSVNYNDLYSGFNQYIAQTDDKQLASTPNVDNLPRFSFRGFLQSLIPSAVYDYFVDHPYTNPGGFEFAAASEVTAPGFKPYRYTYALFNDISISLSVIRSLDLYGYGNLLPLVIRIYDCFCREMEGRTSSQQFSYSGFWNIVDQDEYNVLFDTIPDVILNLWTPLAYNKIFELHYRNPYYDLKFEYISNLDDESASRSFEYVQLFNLDDVNGGVVNDFDRLLCIFAPKFHQYPKDMFTGVLPSTQFGDVSVMTDDRSWLNLQGVQSQGESTRNLQVTGSDFDNPNNITATNGYAVKFRFDPALAISILNQRRADALQRFNENKMRAGVRVKSNFKAHFGYSPKSEQGHEAYYLGSFDGDLSLNTVAATTWNEGQSLGQLGANGVGVVNGNTIHFKNNTDFGVVLCVYYIDKPSEYDSYGILRENVLLDKWDFPYSELQNISLKPLDLLQLHLYDRGHFDNNQLDIILGYLPAFIERKTSVDMTHGEFYSSNPFFTRVDFDNYPMLRKGIFANFVTPRNDRDFANLLSRQYIHPNSVDNIFHVLANSSQDSDQFLVNAQFDCTVVAPLSVLGLPIN